MWRWWSGCSASIRLSLRFAIPRLACSKPVLQLAAEEMDRVATPFVRIGGVCGETVQAVAEAELLQDLGYQAALLSLGPCARPA